MTRDVYRRYDGPVKSAAEFFIKNPPPGRFLIDESMQGHCSFHTGGPAEVFIIPRNGDDLIRVRQICREQDFPFFVLGGGANILVSDKGIPGVVVSMENINEVYLEKDTLISGSGLPVNSLVNSALDNSVTGLEFLNRLPGSVGGALYMNARCYGSEVSDVLSWAEVLTADDTIERIPLKRDDWKYKSSPFQYTGDIILKAAFHVESGNSKEIAHEMARIARSRIEKGHFKAPSAGSTFKNDRSFGKPSGRIIDECGLKGLELGGAAVAPWHGNILINSNNATSKEISDLIIEVQASVLEKTGFQLEPEVIRVGDWD